MSRCVHSLALSTAVACAAPTPARYAGWEPMPEAIPAVESRETALRRLDQSRKLWRQWLAGPPPDPVETGYVVERQNAYTYVRAWQASEARVEFTLFVVRDERVVVRALVSAHPDFLDALRLRPQDRKVRSFWVERGADVGVHRDGLPPRTVDDLYDECAQIIQSRPELSSRIYFHPNGILMHCGFSPARCSECREVSIQSMSRVPLDHARPPNDPEKWVCATKWGVFAPASSVPQLAFTCSGPPVTELAPPSARRHNPAEDICTIDPAACSEPCATDECRVARWSQSRPESCPVGPTREPRPLELGKAEPLAPWSFPFSSGSGVECRRPAPIERLVQPLLE